MDGSVSIRFNRPTGVSVDRVVHLVNPELSKYQPTDDNYILLPDLKSMRPGESTEFYIQIRSNQPQTINIQFDGASQQDRDGTSVRVTTRVVQ